MNKKLNCNLIHGPFEVFYFDKSLNKEISKFFSVKSEAIEYINFIIENDLTIDSELIIFQHHISLREEYFPGEVKFSELGKEFNKTLCLK